ncbi:alkylhydroperoxidase AhpD family core domain-containing protein [Parafrankia irregularis]|uniref:Alkylhydroperoxidase AhpD family core domain-containing protein n=1 Tax=Parafrankia irregularis TaxID=795642 RepID=A0A0S4R0Q3_9ACTN|nr:MULTISPECIES: carboxymuconolactone decarboxylase family protein [Parafrankia]MBE3203515.1 carboxymuconolactone decarboxylase family protein [Parafrankia sp. CH37]CUU60959.1 alkylhydroperoxidase AhpD family core domain-containing protein [Parafrankia irregularis]
MARVEPLRPRQFPPEMGAALAAMIPTEPRYPVPSADGKPRVLGMLGTFAHHPALARAFFTFNGQVLLATTLTPRQRELLVLRVAAARGCDYLWAEHLHLAHEAGLTTEETGHIAADAGRITAGITARADGSTETPFTPFETAFLTAADEIIADGQLTDATWAALSTELDTRQMLDLIFTVGAYETVSAMLRTFGIGTNDPPDPS